MKKIVITFGRMNPPTVGHQKLVDKVVAVGRAENAEARVYLSQTQNKKKDPLDYNTKIRYAQKAFGPIVTKSPHKTIFQILEDLNFNGGYTDVVVVVGSDRVNEFKQLLNKYNGKNYNYDSIKIVSAGERDPDADDVSGMSASKLRGLAMSGDFAAFKNGLPPKLQSIAKVIYDKLRSIMEEAEELDEFRVLNLQQRQKRARMMKRISKKVARMRALKAKRMADQAKLTVRARKKAVQFIRQRVAGQQGKNYKELSAGQKMTIDKLVAKKSSIIGALAKRLMPKVRKAEVERLKKARSVKKEEFDAPNTLMEETMAKKTFQSLFTERSVGPYEKKAKEEIAKDKWQNLQKYDRMRDDARMRDTILRNRGVTTEAYNNLKKKADYINVSVDTILEVYDTATIDPSKKATEEQQRFAAVNHFVAEAVKKPTGDLKDACWKGYTAVGMKTKNGKKVPNCVPVNETIKHEGDKWVIYSKDGSKKLGEYDTETAAKKRLRQIEYFKHQNEETNLDEIGLGTVARYLGKRFRQANNVDGAKLPDKKSADVYLKNVDRASSRLMDTPVKPVKPVNELSTDLLGRYKKKAAADASAADKKGDFKRGNKRFSGIMKATKKQFDNETKEAVATEWSKSRMNEDLEKFLEDADRTLDRLRWADVPQMEPLKRLSNNQLKGYVRDYVSKNKDQVSKFMSTADTGMFGRAIIQKMAPKYIPATQSMTDKDWDNAWKAYDNIDPKIKSNLKKGDTSDFQTNQYVKEDGYKWADFSDAERATIKARQDAIGGSRVNKTPQAFDSASLENRKKLADILRAKPKPTTAADLEPQPRVTPAEIKDQPSTGVKVMKNGYVKEDAQKQNLKSILSKKREAKSTGGAGEWGTDELVKNYVKDTPYMSVQTEDTQLDEIGPLVGLAARGAASLATKGLNKLSKSDWWNKGRNVRVPDENKASLKTLAKDDISQMTRSDAAFKSGDTSVSSLRPMKAFTPDMVKTGPTAAVRQAVERPLKAVSNLMNGYCPETGELIESLIIEEAEHEGKKVKLNDPFRLPAGSKKKFGVYVKNDKGNVVKVTFGDPNMEIKRDDPERRKAFRSRHSCDDDIGPKWKARYWSCYQWRAGKKVDN